MAGFHWSRTMRVAMLLATLLALLVAPTTIGCGGAGTATLTSGDSQTGPTGTTAAPGTSGSVEDWPTYHHDGLRTGISGDRLPLGNVHLAWTSVGLDAAVYAEPLVVGDRVFVATEGNTVYALEAATGKVVWQRNLGESVPGNELPCGNIDPSGVTGTPAIEVESGVMYVVANLRVGPHHELFALTLATGDVLWHRTVDPPGLDPKVEQQRGALALSGGRVYVPFGGLYGDCGQYRGAVVSVALDGSGDLAAYMVPTTRMAGIWNPAGPVVDAKGDLWVTTGNSAGRNSFDFGNAVIHLTPQLGVVDYFAPSDWPRLNAGDVDLGTLGPVLLARDRVLAVGKDGVAYLLDAAHLGQVGHPLASQQVGSSAYGAAAHSDTIVYVPCNRALVALDTSGDKLAIAWSVRGGSGPPIIAASAVWALGYDGQLRALDPVTGIARFSVSLGNPVSRFISLAAAGGRLFVADGGKIVAFALR